MIEKNEAIDFIGEVTILADKPNTSVTIETLTDCVVFMISRADFEMWIAQDIPFLRTFKTINRTIAKLKEDGLIDTCKGKVTMDLAQYKRAQEEISYYVSRHD